jgi:hypothetical protein
MNYHRHNNVKRRSRMTSGKRRMNLGNWNCLEMNCKCK